MATTISYLNREYKNGVEYGTVSVGIPSSEVLTGNSVPIDIIPAKGANMLTIVTEALFFITTYGGTPYATNTDLAIVYDTSLTIINQFTARLATAGTGVFMPSTDSKCGIHSSATAVEANKKIQIYVPSGDPVNGDSNISVFLSYKVINIG